MMMVVAVGWTLDNRHLILCDGVIIDQIQTLSAHVVDVIV